MGVTTLFILFGVILGCAIIVSLILSYHWRSYADGSPVVRRASIVYFAVLGILLASSLLFILTL